MLDSKGWVSVVDKKDSGSKDSTTADDLPEPVDSPQEEVSGDPIATDGAPDTPDETQNTVATEQPEEPAFSDEAPEPEQDTDAGQMPATETATTTRGGFLPALLGGAMAAVLGFLAANTGVLDGVLPASWQRMDPAEHITALENQISNQSERVNSLSGQVQNLAVPDIAPLKSQVDELSGRLNGAVTSVAGLENALKNFEARLNTLEKRPVTEGVSQSAIDAYERELARLQAALATQRTEVEEMIAQARAIDASATEAARQAGTQAMVARIHTALDNGAVFRAEVDELKASGIAVPDSLENAADTGVQTLPALQARYPEVARSALAAARDAQDGGQQGLGGFLKRQLGARSVEPREGNDPDAVLSRAEADLKKGDLGSALDELSTLPDVSIAVMEDWITDAKSRHAVINAVGKIAAEPATN